MRFRSRRDFLKASASTIGMGTLGIGMVAGRDSPLWAADQAQATTGMQLGLVTYNWGRDWDLPTLIKNCEQTRFAGVELRSTHEHGVEITLSAAEREEVAKRFADSSVELVGLGTACDYHASDPAILEKNIKESKAFVDLCHDVGGGGIKVRPNGLPEEVPVEKTLEQIGKSLRRVAEYGADRGIVIRLEVHGRGTSHVPYIKKIMDVADHENAVVCWNCNRQDLEGDGLAANYGLVADKVGTIHIHDLRTNDAYPWPELFALLKKYDFDGWTLLEDGRPPDNIVQAMQENRVIWEKYVA